MFEALTRMALSKRVDELEAALRPFVSLADEADNFGHQPGSSCEWRIAYDDLAAAKQILAKGKESDGPSR